MNLNSPLPKVSVIIPNYNHATYLQQRIETVLAQTYSSFELILMDDCSTDHSLEVLEEYRYHPKVSHFLTNSINGGSTFKQWNAGAKLAKGEYIWIAESDDYAEPQLLEKLVQQLENSPKVGLAYCQSWKVNEQGQVKGTWENWTEDLAPTLFTHDFVLEGVEMVCKYTLYKNVIPNASGVVFRKSIYWQAGGAEEAFRFCGDWLMWAKILLITQVAFVSEPLNYYRYRTVDSNEADRKVRASLAEKYFVHYYIAKATNQLPMLQPIYERLFHHWHNSFPQAYFKKDYLQLYQKISQLDKNLRRRSASFFYHGIKRLFRLE